LIIEAGQDEAKGTIHAARSATAPAGTNATSTKVTATARVNGRSVTKTLSNLGTIKLGEKPKLFVFLETNLSSTTNRPGPEVEEGRPRELTIAPGTTVPARLRIQRNGHDDIVTFFAENLPHGVIVADIGLNGVLIPKGENEREIFFNAAKGVPEQDRLFYVIE